ncbi:phosphoenolpyruvate--protein phosphotransferase [Thermodesulfobacteriota bacterium]
MSARKSKSIPIEPIKGIGVSRGVALAPIHLVEGGKLKVSEKKIDCSEVSGEVERLLSAIGRSKEELTGVKEGLEQKGVADAAFILDFHILFLEDRALVDKAVKLIRQEHINAERAVEIVIEELKRTFEGIEDEYLRERRFDFEYIGNRILRNLMGGQTGRLDLDEGQYIVVAHDLSPADTAQLRKDQVVGFVTEVGSKTAHTAIMARALEIPAVVGLKNITKRVRDHKFMIIDGEEGLVFLDPTQKLVNRYRQERDRRARYTRELLKNRDLPGETRDGFRITLSANIELRKEVPSAIEHGAEGIGLYRTEFLYMNRDDLPTEEEHFHAYREVAEQAAPFSATIRTVDLGGDKYVSTLRVSETVNSIMGLRAIRLCLQEVDLFKTQLRAILRASHYGNIKILIPMISCLSEIRRTREILDEVRCDLRSEGTPFDEEIEIGIMMEVPSAATIADLLADEADFFSIGTNDLIQYTLAIDRTNEHVAYLYNPLNASILRTLNQIVSAAHNKGIAVGMCGEMAGDVFFMPILLGLGLDQLSMNPVSIPRVKRFIRASRYNEHRQLTDHVLGLTSQDEIEEAIRAYFAENFDEISLGLPS